MATRNAFDLLTDFTSDDPSLLACDRLRSADPPKVDRPTHAPRFLPLKKCREIEDQDSNCLFESGFRKKSGASDNRRIGKEVIEVTGGDIRGVVNKGVKRSLLDDPNNKMMCGRKREADGISKDFVRASAKNRHYNFCGFTGRSSLARKVTERKRGGITKSNRCKDRWWVEDEYLDVLESERSKFTYEVLDDFLSDDAFEEQVIRSLIEEHESDDKTMTLEQYGKVMEEKQQTLQATLLEISAKRQEEEDFINEFVIIEAEDDELEADELDDFLLV